MENYFTELTNVSCNSLHLAGVQNIIVYYKYRPIVMFRRVYGIFGQGLVPSDTHDGTIGQ